MRWLTLTALFVAMTVLPATAAAPETDAGLRCRFSAGSAMVAGLVECTVVADEITVLNVTFNRGNCPARYDDPRAERAYFDFWTDTPENRAWWIRSNYHHSYKFGSRLRVEASASCGNIAILEFEIGTNVGSFSWTVTQ